MEPNEESSHLDAETVLPDFESQRYNFFDNFSFVYKRKFPQDWLLESSLGKAPAEQQQLFESSSFSSGGRFALRSSLPAAGRFGQTSCGADISAFSLDCGGHRLWKNCE